MFAGGIMRCGQGTLRTTRTTLKNLYEFILTYMYTVYMQYYYYYIYIYVLWQFTGAPNGRALVHQSTTMKAPRCEP